MREIKFLHFSDLHLDSPFKNMGVGYGTPSSRRQDLKDALAGIIKTAAREKADIILAGGDLFEHKYITRSTIDYVNSLFKSIPDIRIFLIPGNHDPYIEGSYYRHYEWSTNVCILAGAKPYAVIEELGLCVFGAGFASFYQDRCPLSTLPPVKRGMANILLAHATVGLPDAISGSRYNPVTSEELGSLGMDYIALGHYHNRLDDPAGIKAYNPGSPEPLGFDEPGGHGYYLGRIETGSREGADGIALTDISFIQSARREYKVIDVSADGACSESEILEAILDAASAHKPGANILKAVIKGRTGRTGMEIDPRLITEKLAKSDVYSMTFQDESLPGYDNETLSEWAAGRDLRGLYISAVLEMMGTAAPKETGMLRKALRYGLDALDKGCVDLFED